MAVAEVELPFSRVAVIDDNDRDAETTRYGLKAFGLEPVEIAIDDRDLEDILAEVHQRAEAAVCDHYLRGHKRVDFSGAEAVARLTKDGMPTCLVTMYATDVDVDIRRYRGLIPSLLLRGNADMDELAAALLRSHDELRKGPPREREAYRTTITIERISDEAHQPVADVLVGGWSQDEAIRFPLAIMPDELVPQNPADLEGAIFFAEVNLGAESASDLFFQDFKRTPDSDLGERLIKEAPGLDWGVTEDRN